MDEARRDRVRKANTQYQGITLDPDRQPITPVTEASTQPATPPNPITHDTKLDRIRKLYDRYLTFAVRSDPAAREPSDDLAAYLADAIPDLLDEIRRLTLDVQARDITIREIAKLLEGLEVELETRRLRERKLIEELRKTRVERDDTRGALIERRAQYTAWQHDLTNQLTETIRKVRELHSPTAGEGETKWCSVCSQEEAQPAPTGWWVPWPCPTITTLSNVDLSETELQHADTAAPDAEV